LGPISRETCAELHAAAYAQFDVSLIEEVFASTLGSSNAAPGETATPLVTVDFIAVAFVNHCCHMHWNVAPKKMSG
jgi:hypothetical protein